ncbi:MAG TPA: acyltransferase [Cytophagales bacterium]|nr:acyltransferase [Cytophagales bacterium]
MLNSFTHRYREFKERNKDASFIEFLGSVYAAAMRLILAKIYLRKCQKVGAMVTVSKKPLLVNKGYIDLGDSVRIWSSINRAKIFVEKGGILKVGENSRINGAHISSSVSVEIGKNVRIAPYVIIIDDDYHDIKDHFAETSKKGAIVIEDDVWLAMSCKILKGVRVGKGSVVATGAVVTKDVPPYTVVAGVPAKVIKNIPQS